MRATIAIAVPVIGASGGIAAAIIDRPAAAAPNCIARDAQIAQLVREQPELAKILERPDPLDHLCGPAREIVLDVVSHHRSS